VAIAPLLCPKGVVVGLKREIVEGKGGKEGEGGWGKEGEGGRLATILWPTGHAWPPLNPYFHPPLRLALIMLTRLTKNIKSKSNIFHSFPKFFLFIYFDFFRFYIMQWWNKHAVEKE
jgi:hypothetical protein